MKKLIFATLILMTTFQCFAQQRTDNKKEINNIIEKYSKSVIEKDSIAFYDLFNDDVVTWCAAIKDRSQAKEVDNKGLENARSSYFSATYKGFMRNLYKYKSTEDKFDNIRIIEDGTVASVTMDYSFWADHKMTNWGCKYLSLIKREGKWKITSVIYSLELTTYFGQPSLNDRKRQSKKFK